MRRRGLVDGDDKRDHVRPERDRQGAGGKGGDLLVPDMHPLELALAADGVRQAVQAIADNAVNPLDASGCERVGELIRHGLRHVSLSPEEDCRKPQYCTIRSWRRLRPEMNSALIRSCRSGWVTLDHDPARSDLQSREVTRASLLCG